MEKLLLVVVLLGAISMPVPCVTADVKGLMYMRPMDDRFDEFLAASDNVKVVYFCKGTWRDLFSVLL